MMKLSIKISIRFIFLYWILLIAIRQFLKIRFQDEEESEEKHNIMTAKIRI